MNRRLHTQVTDGLLEVAVLFPFSFSLAPRPCRYV